MSSATLANLAILLSVPVRDRQVRPLKGSGEPDDGELVGRAQGGDSWAVEKLYRRHVQAVFGLAARLLRSSSEAEDVVQETFAIALEQLPSLRDGSAFRAWLARIAVSRVRRRFRRNKVLRLVRVETGAEDATLEALAAERAGADVLAELAMLDRVLRELPTEQRLVWMLRHVEGESLEDVATIAGCSLATAKRWIAAADARVRIHVTIDGRLLP